MNILLKAYNNLTHKKRSKKKLLDSAIDAVKNNVSVVLDVNRCDKESFSLEYIKEEECFIIRPVTVASKRHIVLKRVEESDKTDSAWCLKAVDLWLDITKKA